MRTYVPETGVTFLSANGIEHGYFEYPAPSQDAPLVLMFHGFPDTPHTWDGIAQPIAAAGFRVITPFLRGYAPSGIPEADTDLRTQGEDILALMDAFDAPSAILVGHDWGASAVYAATSLAPERVQRLVTVAIPHPASIKPSFKTLWAVRHFFSLRLPGAVSRFARDDFAELENLVRRWGPTWDFAAEDVEPAKNAFSASGSCNAAIGYYRKLTPPPRWARVPVDVPTLSIAGADDPNIAPADFERARRFFPGGYEVATVRGGHFCHREDPETFTRHVLEFLRR